MSGVVVMSGRLIAFEGIDGSGLSTHAAALHHFLTTAQRQRVHLTKEPTDGPAGSQVRLRLRGRLSVDDATLALLFAADRVDHLETEILPRLEAGVHVISDRYYLSSLAYQSLTVDLDWVRAINARHRRPDVTIFLNLPAEVALRRLQSRRWQLELYEELDKLRAVRSRYQELIHQLRRDGQNVVTVDCLANSEERSIEAVAADIQIAVLPFLTD